MHRVGTVARILKKVNLPDGDYDGVVVLEAVHPITFLLESR